MFHLMVFESLEFPFLKCVGENSFFFQFTMQFKFIELILYEIAVIGSYNTDAQFFIFSIYVNLLIIIERATVKKCIKIHDFAYVV